MITKAVGIKSAELVDDPTGNPGSKSLRIVPESGGEILINVTVAEMGLLKMALIAASPTLPHAFKQQSSLDAVGFRLNSEFGKVSLPPAHIG